jgi:hypothetical protein
VSEFMHVRCDVHRGEVIGVIRLNPADIAILWYPHLGRPSRMLGMNAHGDTAGVTIGARDPSAVIEIPCPRFDEPRRVEVGRLLEEWNRRQGFTRRGGVLV